MIYMLPDLNRLFKFNIELLKIFNYVHAHFKLCTLLAKEKIFVILTKFCKLPVLTHIYK